MSDTIIMYENGKAVGGEGHPISGGGHAIQDNSGADMPQEDNLQFVGLKVTDDSTNGKTIVDATDKVTWEANGILGAKNLLFYPYPFTFPQTNHGITFTDNNGVIEISGTQDNQENSIANVFNAWGKSNSVKLEPNTKYIINGCPSGGSASSYVLQPVLTDSSNNHIWLSEFGDGLKFTTDSTHLYFGLRIVIVKGYTGSSLVFKPMLRLAEDTDDTYEPYAMTNKQLTDNKANKTDIATIESGTTASRAYSVGELVYVSGTLYRVKTAIASGATFTVGTNVEVTNVSTAMQLEVNNLSLTASSDKMTYTGNLDTSKFKVNAVVLANIENVGWISLVIPKVTGTLAVNGNIGDITSAFYGYVVAEISSAGVVTVILTKYGVSSTKITSALVNYY